MAKKVNAVINKLHIREAPKAVVKMLNKKYGRLLVLYYAGDRVLPKGQYQTIVIAQCDCGNINTYIANHINGGKSRSCGCLQAEQSAIKFTVHGNKKGYMPRGTKEYSTWQSIKHRCKVNTQYISLGIKVCERWFNSFENFISDMGLKPSDEYTLERVDNNKGYEPSNCKWATRLEQANNTRRNKFIIINNERLTLSQANRKYNIGHSKAKTIYNQQNNIKYDNTTKRLLESI